MNDKLKVSRIFTQRIRAAREEARLSQSELAEAAGLQQSALSQYEGGQRRPSFTNLKRLARALGVSVDYLVGNSKVSVPRSLDDDPLVAAVLELGVEDRKLVSGLVESLLSRKR